MASKEVIRTFDLQVREVTDAGAVYLVKLHPWDLVRCDGLIVHRIPVKGTDGRLVVVTGVLRQTTLLLKPVVKLDDVRSPEVFQVLVGVVAVGQQQVYLRLALFQVLAGPDAVRVGVEEIRDLHDATSRFM